MWQPQLTFESELSATHGLNARSSAPGPILGDSENFGRCGLASGSGSPGLGLWRLCWVLGSCLDVYPLACYDMNNFYHTLGLHPHQTINFLSLLFLFHCEGPNPLTLWTQISLPLLGCICQVLWVQQCLGATLSLLLEPTEKGFAFVLWKPIKFVSSF